MQQPQNVLENSQGRGSLHAQNRRLWVWRHGGVASSPWLANGRGAIAVSRMSSQPSIRPLDELQRAGSTSSLVPPRREPSDPRKLGNGTEARRSFAKPSPKAIVLRRWLLGPCAAICSGSENRDDCVCLTDSGSKTKKWFQAFSQCEPHACAASPGTRHPGDTHGNGE
jgi:hypothetical protein